jgi:cellulose synthase/poly-beta-1,6-N-acetylglucosamine synthase-like glycosyltransferase
MLVDCDVYATNLRGSIIIYIIYIYIYICYIILFLNNIIYFIIILKCPMISMRVHKCNNLNINSMYFHKSQSHTLASKISQRRNFELDLLHVIYAITYRSRFPQSHSRS